jgi:hypothetical protein
MSDVEWLFAVLAAIYVWECMCWIPRGTVAFRNVAGKKWFLSHPGSLAGNQRGGLVPAFPLPPLGRIVIAQQFPASLSRDAAFSFVSAAVNPGLPPIQNGKTLPADSIKTIVSEGKKVMINDQAFLKTSSVTFALQIAEQFRRWRDAPADKRRAVSEAILRAAFDFQSARERWQAFEKQIGPLRWLTNGLFVYLFIFAPLLILYRGFESCWFGLLLGLPVFTVACAICFFAVHRRFYPAAGDERFTQFLITLLSPATTIRVQDVLSRPLLDSFHPLAVASLFCDEKTFHEYARKILLETRYPQPPNDFGDTFAQEAEREWRGLLLQETEQFLKRQKLDLAALTRPPMPGDAASLSWCPRCETQFTTRTGTCADCGGLELIPFGETATK